MLNTALNDPLNLCNGCDAGAATEPGGYCKLCLEADSAHAGDYRTQEGRHGYRR